MKRENEMGGLLTPTKKFGALLSPRKPENLCLMAVFVLCLCQFVVDAKTCNMLYQLTDNHPPIFEDDT